MDWLFTLHFAQHICVAMIQSLPFVPTTYYIVYYHSILRPSRSPIALSRCNMCAVPRHCPIRKHEATISHQLLRAHLLPENAGFSPIITSDARCEAMGSRGTEEQDGSVPAHLQSRDAQNQDSAGTDYGESTRFSRGTTLQIDRPKCSSSSSTFGNPTLQRA